VETQVKIQRDKIKRFYTNAFFVGCNGGSAAMSYNYIIKNGIALSKEYPYESTEGNCRKSEVSRSEVELFGFSEISSEIILKKALAQFGPVVVLMNALPKSFNFYKKGIYNDASCSSNKYNHAVLFVGYGRDENIGMDYWIVKNSWSKSWGENGYVKIGLSSSFLKKKKIIFMFFFFHF
jgi:cathepsin L